MSSVSLLQLRWISSGERGWGLAYRFYDVPQAHVVSDTARGRREPPREARHWQSTTIDAPQRSGRHVVPPSRGYRRRGFDLCPNREPLHESPRQTS